MSLTVISVSSRTTQHTIAATASKSGGDKFLVQCVYETIGLICAIMVVIIINVDL